MNFVRKNHTKTKTLRQGEAGKLQQNADPLFKTVVLVTSHKKKSDTYVRADEADAIFLSSYTFQAAMTAMLRMKRSALCFFCHLYT